jgi:ankyrin repeat protein
MDKWKAFGQGGELPGTGLPQAAAAAPAPAPSSSTSADAKAAALAMTLKEQPPDGSGMDALLRAVVYKQWDGLVEWVTQPDFCVMTDNRGCTPLHLTVSHDGPLDVVESLLATWPAGAAALDADGATALHHAVAKRAAAATVSAVLNANPEAARLQSTLRLTVPTGESDDSELMQAIATSGSAHATEGFTPLHWALLMRSPVVVNLVLEADGDHGKRSAAVPCGAGRLPLHTAAANKASGETIELLIKAHPSALKTSDLNGATPLHHGAAHGAPLESLVIMSTQHPAAVQAKAMNGWTPLHYLAACGEGATVEATRLFVNAWSGAVRAPDDNGRTPLHVACALGSPLVVVNSLLQRWTGAAAARQADAAGNTPLHHAAQKSTNAQVIHAVRAAYPAAAVAISSDAGCTPAHLAASRGAEMTVVMMSALLQGENEHPSLLLCSYRGLTPLHAAIASDCSADVVQMLTRMCPKACHVSSNEGRTPLHVAALETTHGRACSEPVVLALIDAAPETVHLLQSRAPLRAGSAEDGAHLVESMKRGQVAVREAIEKIEKEGAAASDGMAAELLAMIEAEQVVEEDKKKKSKIKKKKKKSKAPEAARQSKVQGTDKNEKMQEEKTEKKMNVAVTTFNALERQPAEQRGNGKVATGQVKVPAATEDDDGGEWMTSGRSRKGRRSKAKQLPETLANQTQGGRMGILGDKQRPNPSPSAPASTPQPDKPAGAASGSDPASVVVTGGGNGGIGGNHHTGGGPMLMEELWEFNRSGQNVQRPPPIRSAAPVVKHKRPLRSRQKDIPAGLERQRAGKQLFMEALWAERGRGSQVSARAVSYNTGLRASHGGYAGTAESCPQCGWQLPLPLPPKHKLVITDPTTGAEIVAPPLAGGASTATTTKDRKGPTGSASILEWNVSDAVRFVEGLGLLAEYSDVLVEHEVDGSALSGLDTIGSKGFEIIGIVKYGHMHKIASAVAALKQQPSSATDANVPAPAPAAELSSRAKPGPVTPPKNSVSAGSLVRRGKAVGGLDLFEPPNEFFCPLSFEMMSDPVVASDGHTYERLDIERWVRNTHQVKASAKGGVGGAAGSDKSAALCSSPLTGEAIDGRLVPNQAIKRQIQV